MKLEDGSFLRDYVIPRQKQKVAILRVEHPIDEHDMNQFRKFLEFLAITIPPSGDKEEVT